MCGIVGEVRWAGGLERSTIDGKLALLRHRGPDAEGIWVSQTTDVALGHRRLAIIDLSPRAAQPMRDEGGRCHLVLNGEIYNFRELKAELRRLGRVFTSDSDTEVLLNAYLQWGDDCLERLQGMYAFALYDSARQRMLIARDRVGEKPLFYIETPTGVSFASEVKALIADPAVPRRLDPAAFDQYLAYGYVAAPLCMIEGVRKLPPAHAMVVDLPARSIGQRRYWSLPRAAVRGKGNIDQLASELKGLLAASVKRQLVADVPLGVMLSGGVDSSLITAVAARQSSERIRTFTVTFPGQQTHDESRYARIVAEHFGTEHYELTADSITVDDLRDLARQFDEPIADSSLIPTHVLSRAIREHATVALGGDGGDELFGGYLHYSWLRWQNDVRRALPKVARGWIAAAGYHLPFGFPARNYVLGLSDGRSAMVSQVNTYFDARARRQLTVRHGGHVERHASAEALKGALAVESSSVLRAATSVDFHTFLPDDLLAKVDRASMLASLEVRAPFLDRDLIEFAFARVPDDLRATRTKRKVLLKRVARELLPAELDLTRKQGFSLPLDYWYTHGWGTTFRGLLAEANRVWLDPNLTQALIKAQERGRSNMQRIFALAMLELWRQEYRIDFEPAICA